MGETSLSNKITHYLLENHTIELNGKNNVRIDDFTLAGNGKAKRFVNAIIQSNRKKVVKAIEDFSYLSDKEMIEEVSNVLPSIEENLRDYCLDKKLSKIENSNDLKINKQDYLNAVPVVDMEDPRGNSIMVDKATGRVVPIMYKSWIEVMGQAHVSQVKQIGYCGRFVYNPYSLEPFTEETTSIGRETIYNKFIPPDHRFERRRDVVLDDRYIEFLYTLFEDPCRDYALNWIYHTVFKKSPVYLLLVGSGGIGKNLLAESLRYLHGVTNFNKAHPSCLDTKFNGHLMDCTMIYYDECKFSASHQGSTIRKNKLKEWANDYVPIEVKGIDARNVDIYASAIIATNNDSDVHIEQLDRKFSPMELTTERLEKRLGVETAKFLWNYIKTEEFRHGALNWLETIINPDFDLQQEYKGPKFDHLVMTSLSNWQSELFEMITSRETEMIDLKQFREDVAYAPTKDHKIKDFLSNFYHEGVTLGEIKFREGKKHIIPNDKFLPPRNDLELDSD